MSALDLTPHAVARLAQRAIASDDIEFITLIGTDVESGILVRQKDFQVFEQQVKRLLERGRRLVGKRVVIDGDRIVTAYHADRAKERRLLKKE